MQSVSISYALKWRVINAPDYCITSCRKVVNVRTGRVLKRCYCGGSIGYWIGRRFVRLVDLNKEVELIKKEKCPF